MIRRTVMAAAAVILSLTAIDAYAQNPIKWSLKVGSTSSPLKPGDRFNVQVIANIEAGWHLYAITQPPGGPTPTRITLPSGQPFKAGGAVKSPPSLTDFDQNFGIDTEFFEGSATFTLPVTVARDAPAGKHKLRVNAFFQTCNDRLCLPATTVKMEALVEVAAETISSTTVSASEPEDKSPVAQAETKTPDQSAGQPQTGAESSEKTDAASLSASPSSSEPSVAAQSPGAATNIARTTAPAGGVDTSQSLLSFIWLAMTVGALSLLTPCVFPMIPITVSYFTSHSASSRGAALRNAFIYSGGIILTFTALGMALALFVGAAGINLFAANPWVNLLITAIFLGFAMNLFGAYQIRVPSALLTRLDALTRREGGSQMIGMLLTGLVFTLTSFTCTAPFVGTLLVMAAQGEWQWPLLGMLAFSTVFALPFFVLAMMPQLLSQMPRSGGWLNSVKVVMGLLEVAAAMKFISNVDLVWHWGIFTREVVVASWVAVAGLITFYLLGKFRLSEDAPVERIGAVRLMMAIAFLALSLYLLTGLFGRRLGEVESFLPPAAEGTFMAGGGEGGELPWIVNDYEGALSRARQEKKLVLIDFTGYTCTNCRWMEANMFPKAEVRREMEKYIRVRLYTDGEGEIYGKHQRLEQEKFGTVALPYYALVDSEGNPMASFAGLTRNPSEFIAFLKTPYPSAAQTD
ncbi:MAG: thioredoxin family protein [Blastocatellia bacterium]|nr:thioredoxin family protein [Blastocatellia bacterium]